jgi:hypothetical protein
MAKFVPIDPKDIDLTTGGRRGRVSYPLLKEFLETGVYCARLDRTGMQQSLQSLNSSLNAYIRGHKMPIKLFNRGGEIHFIRLDINPDGSQNKDWNPDLGMLNSETGIKMGSTPINPAEVKRRFETEKGQITK